MCETGTGHQVAQLHVSWMMMMMMVVVVVVVVVVKTVVVCVINMMVNYAYVIYLCLFFILNVFSS